MSFSPLKNFAIMAARAARVERELSELHDLLERATDDEPVRPEEHARLTAGHRSR